MERSILNYITTYLIDAVKDERRLTKEKGKIGRKMFRYWVLLLSLALHLFQCVLWLRHESDIHLLRGDISTLHSVSSGPHNRAERSADPGPEVNENGAIEGDVEFIHPKLRDEMEEIEKEDPNNPWVWLTSYSRIPVSECIVFPVQEYVFIVSLSYL